MASGEAVDEVCKLWVESAAAKLQIRKCKVRIQSVALLLGLLLSTSLFGVRFCSDSVGGRGAFSFFLSETCAFAPDLILWVCCNDRGHDFLQNAPLDASVAIHTAETGSHKI